MKQLTIRLPIWGTFFWIMMMSTSVIAQTVDCPATVLLALSRAGSTCFGVELSEACYGNGSVTASYFDDNFDGDFSATGDIAPITPIETLTTHASNEDLSVASIFLQANLADSEQRNTALLLFGETNVTNLIPPIQEFTITADGTINIRELPDITGEIVQRLGLSDIVVVNGRTEDGEWLRVRIPNSNDLGWIPSGVASENDPINALEIVDETTPFYRPFQIMTLTTGYDDALCDDTTESGILLQTPNLADDVELIINGAELRISATLFIQNQSDSMLAMYVLDGELEIALEEDTYFVPAGAYIELPLNSAENFTAPLNIAQPYDETQLSAVPINNLPDRVAITIGLTQAELDASLEAWAMVIPEQAVDNTITRNEVCRYTINQRANLWGGPGLFYEAVNEITSGSRVVPVLQTSDADDVVWWQLDNSNWIRAQVVDATGNCEQIPIVNDVPPPPTNTLSMETCMSINGPIRTGQIVIIQFTPAPWDSYEAALAATRVDAGQITVNEEALYITAGAPILRSGTDNIWFRIFSTTWLAESGTFRFVSRRTSYILTCNITVPFE